MSVLSALSSFLLKDSLQSHLRRALQMSLSGVLVQLMPCIFFCPPILEQNDFLLPADLGDFLACFLETGGFRFEPCVLLKCALPFLFRPPSGF